MARAPNRKRVGVSMTGRTDDRGRVQQVEGARRKLSPDRLVCVAEDARGTLLRVDGEESDTAVSESLDDLIAASDGTLIKLTPVGFADVRAGETHEGRGQHIAVNIDHLTILPTADKRGTVIRVAKAPRDIVVRETAVEIEALIDGE